MVLKSWVTRGDSSPGQELKTNVGMGSELEQLDDALESNASTIEISIATPAKTLVDFRLLVWMLRFLFGIQSKVVIEEVSGLNIGASFDKFPMHMVE